VEMKHFYSVGNYSPGGEAFKEHSGEFEEAYLGDIDDEVSDWIVFVKISNGFDPNMHFNK